MFRALLRRTRLIPTQLLPLSRSYAGGPKPVRVDFIREGVQGVAAQVSVKNPLLVANIKDMLAKNCIPVSTMPQCHLTGASKIMVHFDSQSVISTLEQVAQTILQSDPTYYVGSPKSVWINILAENQECVQAKVSAQNFELLVKMRQALLKHSIPVVDTRPYQALGTFSLTVNFNQQSLIDILESTVQKALDMSRSHT